MVQELEQHLTMSEIMRRWPATIQVILRHRLLCVGCPIAAFHTLEDAIREHEVEAGRLRADLRRAIGLEE